jgi:hypothetical protein
MESLVQGLAAMIWELNRLGCIALVSWLLRGRDDRLMLGLLLPQRAGVPRRLVSVDGCY